RDHLAYLAVFPPLLTPEERKALAPILAAHHIKMDTGSPVVMANPDAELLRYVAEQPMAGGTLCSVPLRYGLQPIAHHLLGYVHPTTGRGIAGLEAVYDELLASDRLVKLVLMTDANRRPIPGLGWRYQEEAKRQPAGNLVLTLDCELQSKVEALLEEAGVAKGAVVLLEVGTGKVRALASRPVFNPYCPQLSLNDPDRALLNRALAAYPPGGVWRLMMAAAALEQGLARPDQVFLTATEAGTGLTTLTQAFAYDRQAVFQEVAAILESKAVLALAKAFGLGTAALRLPGEEAGFLSLETAGTAAAGPGERITVTPLQMAAVLQVVAGNGTYYPPTVVEGWQAEDGRRSPFPAEGGPGCPVLTAATVTALRKMMEATVLYGTGQKAQIRQEAAGIDGTVLAGRRGEQPILYSWFAGYAPAHAPRLVGVVLLEDEPGGAERAAALFAALMESCLPLL
ncbi:MAG: hypothetical protein GX202_03890, partial [Firmicutes bacterium]|nr:hypothetical protein [Bacillota bacterium]